MSTIARQSGDSARRARAISRGSCSSSARRFGSPVRASLRARLSTSREQLLAFGLDPLQLGDVGRAGVDQRLVRRRSVELERSQCQLPSLARTRVSSADRLAALEDARPPRAVGALAVVGVGELEQRRALQVLGACSRGSCSQAALTSTQRPSRVDGAEHVVGEVEEAAGAQVGAGAAGDDDAGQAASPRSARPR